MKYRYGAADVFGIPGGGVADNETLTDTLKRELIEELGITIAINELICLVETPAAGKVEHTLHCVFTGKVLGGDPRINTEHTTAASVEWADELSLENMVLYPPINDIIKEAFRGITCARYLGLRKREWF